MGPFLPGCPLSRCINDCENIPQGPSGGSLASPRAACAPGGKTAPHRALDVGPRSLCQTICGNWQRCISFLLTRHRSSPSWFSTSLPLFSGDRVASEAKADRAGIRRAMFTSRCRRSWNPAALSAPASPSPPTYNKNKGFSLQWTKMQPSFTHRGAWSPLWPRHTDARPLCAGHLQSAVAPSTLKQPPVHSTGHGHSPDPSSPAGDGFRCRPRLAAQQRLSGLVPCRSALTPSRGHRVQGAASILGLWRHWAPWAL